MKFSIALICALLLLIPLNNNAADNKNYALASQISYGLKQAIKDGSFKTKLENHPITSHLFPLSKWGGKRLFLLKNDQQDLQATQDAWWLLKEFPFYEDIKFK
jgi:hypothetical protein